MFATGPRAVGFTIVWPEGVIFRSMMTYHAQFLLLVVAGWVNRQQQDVIDYQQEENRVCSEPGFGASVSGSRTTSGAGSPSRPRLWAARRWPRLRPLPHPLRFCVGTAAREVKILMRLPDSRNVATRQAVHGSAPCARTEVTGRWLGTAADSLALAINAGSTSCGAQVQERAEETHNLQVVVSWMLTCQPRKSANSTDPDRR